MVYGSGSRNPTQQRSPVNRRVVYSRFPAGDFDTDLDLDLTPASIDVEEYWIQYRGTDGTYTSPISYYSAPDTGYGRSALAADFNRDGKSDILVTTGSSGGFAAKIELFLNGSSGGHCTVPTSNGINICSPADNSTVQSPVRLRAAAKLSGAVYRFEVWANGTKIYTGRETSTIDAAVDMAPGTYMMTFVARTASGERQEKTIKVTVGSGQSCGRPASAGIVVCEPAAFAEVTSPFRVHAFANTGSAPTYRFELWVGSNKIINIRDGDVMDASVSLPRGTHRLIFIARRLDGTRYTKDVTVTVK